jgi:regulatory protein
MREKVSAAAFKLLAARPRSESQLREQLLSKPWVDPEAVEECIMRLKEMGYIDDRAFARNYASARVSIRPVGRARVFRELADKRVSRGLIDETLRLVFDEVGEESLIDSAIKKRIRSHGRPSDRGEAKRMFDHLARLGFEYSLIIRKLKALKSNLGESDE